MTKELGLYNDDIEKLTCNICIFIAGNTIIENVKFLCKTSVLSVQINNTK